MTGAGKYVEARIKFWRERGGDLAPSRKWKGKGESKGKGKEKG